jgi:hypothetical protein
MAGRSRKLCPQFRSRSCHSQGLQARRAQWRAQASAIAPPSDFADVFAAERRNALRLLRPTVYGLPRKPEAAENISANWRNAPRLLPPYELNAILKKPMQMASFA